MATAVQGSNPSANDVFSAIGLGSKTKAKADANSMQETQDRFLKMLVTQIRNQDPLNPMQQAEMTSQLAQINMVNGIEKLNASIAGLLGAYQDSQAMQAADMIGKHVLVEGKNIELTAAGGLAGYELSGPADKLKVTITDGNGLVMRTLNIDKPDAGAGNFFWDGKTNSGQTATPGKYSFAVEASLGDKAVGSEALTVGTVNAVTRGSKGFELDLGDLGGFAFTDIKQIL